MLHLTKEVIHLLAMKYSEQLSLEQEFDLRRLSTQVRTLSEEQAQDLSLELYRQMMLKDNLYRELLKDYWGMGSIESGSDGKRELGATLNYE